VNRHCHRKERSDSLVEDEFIVIFVSDIIVRLLQGNDLVGEDGVAVDIGLEVVRFTLGNLRGHVSRASNLLGHEESFLVLAVNTTAALASGAHSSNVEIKDLEFAVDVESDVVGFQVTVDNILTVKVGNGIGKLLSNIQSFSQQLGLFNHDSSGLIVIVLGSGIGKSLSDVCSVGDFQGKIVARLGSLQDRESLLPVADRRRLGHGYEGGLRIVSSLNLIGLVEFLVAHAPVLNAISEGSLQAFQDQEVRIVVSIQVSTNTILGRAGVNADDVRVAKGSKNVSFLDQIGSRSSE